VCSSDLYIVSVVPPAQRTAAAGVTGAARSVAAAPGPAVAGALVQIGAMSLPFFVSGGVKIAYDLTLFALFRRVKPLEEAPVGQAEETSRPVLPPLEGGS
jgi:MFS family permease